MTAGELAPLSHPKPSLPLKFGNPLRASLRVAAATSTPRPVPLRVESRPFCRISKVRPSLQPRNGLETVRTNYSKPRQQIIDEKKRKKGKKEETPSYLFIS
jgi:hypothetical protein